MGKPTGFLEYKRETAKVLPPKVRIANFNEFRTPLSKEKQIFCLQVNLYTKTSCICRYYLL